MNMLGSDYQLVKTHTLKVQIHCDGCARKVKKLLKKIEGVYLVSIDPENQKVKVAGTVDSAKLIRKLIKSGKHAEVWSPMPDQNHNLQGLPSWLLDATYQDLLQPQGQTNGLHAFKSHPMIMEPDVDWRRRKYLNPNTGMNSFMDEAINNGATNSGKNPQLGWNQYIAPDELEMEENMRSLSFPDSRNSAGDYSGIVDKAFPGFQQLLPPPAYEHHYSPFRPSNNNLQQHKHNLPSNSPVQPTNLEYYNPTLVRWNNMQQNQLASPNYDQPFIPTHEMRNNLLQYQYNTPVPLKMNTDILNRHLQLGIMNQRPSPAIDSNWNYY